MSRESMEKDNVATALFSMSAGGTSDSFDTTLDDTSSSGTTTVVNKSYSSSSAEHMAVDEDIPSPPRSTRKSPSDGLSFHPTTTTMMMMTSADAAGGKPPSTPKTRLFFDDNDDVGPKTTTALFGKTPIPPRRTYRPTSFSSAEDDSDTTMGGYSPSPAASSSSRKRSSTCAATNNATTSSMEDSPKISPNSFLTMDGRFVQSKNPFSSPITMMSEEETTTDFVSAGQDAPSLPMFQHSCSPVPEHGLPGVASYHKVRRLHEDEDVVAASLYHFPPRISPTEVSSFPSFASSSLRNNTAAPRKPLKTPPTPIKKRHNNQSSGPFHGLLQVKPASQSRFETDFDVIGELGQGTFGRVLKVLSRLDGCMYAIKTALRPPKGAAARDRMLKEVCACVRACGGRYMVYCTLPPDGSPCCVPL